MPTILVKKESKTTAKTEGAKTSAKTEEAKTSAIETFNEVSIYGVTLRQLRARADVLNAISEAKAMIAEAEADIRYYSKKAESERRSQQINEAMTAKARAEGVINSHPEPMAEIESAKSGLRVMIKEAEAILNDIAKAEAEASKAEASKTKASKTKASKTKASKTKTEEAKTEAEAEAEAEDKTKTEEAKTEAKTEEAE